MAPVAIFDRSNPDRNRSAAKWFEQLRDEHMRLEPGHPGMPLVGTDPAQTAAMRRAAGCHEVKLPERGIIQLCRHCRRGTRDSLWLVRCGPCGEAFSPVLWLATSCDACGGPDEAMEQLVGHLARVHDIRH